MNGEKNKTKLMEKIHAGNGTYLEKLLSLDKETIILSSDKTYAFSELITSLADTTLSNEFIDGLLKEDEPLNSLYIGWCKINYADYGSFKMFIEECDPEPTSLVDIDQMEDESFDIEN